MAAQATVEAVICDSVSGMLETSDPAIAVLCGDESRPCVGLNELSKDGANDKVILVWACPSLGDDAAGDDIPEVKVTDAGDNNGDGGRNENASDGDGGGGCSNSDGDGGCSNSDGSKMSSLSLSGSDEGRPQQKLESAPGPTEKGDDNGCNKADSSAADQLKSVNTSGNQKVHSISTVNEIHHHHRHHGCSHQSKVSLLTESNLSGGSFSQSDNGGTSKRRPVKPLDPRSIGGRSATTWRETELQAEAQRRTTTASGARG